MLKNKNTSIIKSTAKQLGFDFCGISKAEFLKKETNHTEIHPPRPHKIFIDKLSGLKKDAEKK